MKKSTKVPLFILASKSPRRQYLLKQAGLDFLVVPSRLDENKMAKNAPEEYVIKLAEAKAEDVAQKYPESWVIGADTIVVIGDAILGKPRSKDDARNMLLRLSGQTHQVYTGFAVCCKAEKRLFSQVVKTDVLFKELSDQEIQWYIHTPEPFDKAGAYAIQGMGTFLVRSIHGSYTNVVGLPVCEVIEFLIKEGLLGFQKNSRIHRYESGNMQC
ncbi:MAG: Maf family protein [Desulfobacterales bacterium]|jgi:septum formation protein|nr:Maf family protein [Desulfobacterales bacterium]